ncbi:virginiamycin B lyase family protein [Pseudomaricurvus hydrocarbonicus]|uniref:virginiamycin B lyase family protein n=1 Tax=Pseudomaricurvus hydrocarbonicus TaxID=1470433 RepID=UPI001AA0388D|nr:hypothetical protein [Aestuariicella hydrocarbonica]
MGIFKRVMWPLLVLASGWGQAATVAVTNEQGEPMATVMVSQKSASVPALEMDAHGYPKPGQLNQSPVEFTRFTNQDGVAEFPDNSAITRVIQAAANNSATVSYRFRKPGFYDVNITAQGLDGHHQVVMKPLSSAAELAEEKPSNLWLSQLDFDGDLALKKHFQINCAFCHQQASPVMRVERSPEQWLQIIERMGGYGARVADDDRQQLAEYLTKGYRQLRLNAENLPDMKPWEAELARTEITEWPIGDAFSQMHDFILHPNGMVYVGDNLQDRIYEVNPETGEYSVYVVPHEAGEQLGGFLGNRFTTYPKLANYAGVHSFAVSPVDGHIFITPSMQRALIEFDPVSKSFTTHKMQEGFYPHTIRVDEQDRMWFTLALSSQVGRFDRNTQTFKVYDLPARSFKEWAILKSLPLVFMFDRESRPEPEVDRESTGVPMPYGIDVAPDGKVWFGRLYADDIGYIDPADDSVHMIKVPFKGPRRLRVDADNNVWVVSFQGSKLVKYDPVAERFTQYELPVVNELPYSLNVDRQRGVVWVNGNQSDNVFRFDIRSESWQTYPLPRKRSFTRDIEIDEDGSIFTSNSHFPSWQIEDGQPTLIRIRPLETPEGAHARAVKAPGLE